jgi:hypothetical protein
MKTTIQRLSTEIEYLQALAALYAENRNGEAHRATLAAIESLKRLVEVIDGRKECPCKPLPVAA